METKVYKTCRKCGKVLPVTEFIKRNNSKDGYSYKCRDCFREEMAERRERRYGLTKLNPQRGVKATFKLSDFEDKMLFAELKRRGYAGELQFTKTVNL